MARRSIPKGVVKDIVIVGIGILLIWIGLQVVFGTPNPFYVVASGSMIPVLEVHDVLVVQGHVQFEDIVIGDIIVFDRPSDHNRVIVHRVVSITNDDPRTLRTQGDANPGSIPGTDFPITEEEYIGKVEHILPQVGFITQLLKPPVNYIIIAIVIGIMIFKQVAKKKNEESESENDVPSSPANNSDKGPEEELSDIEKMDRDPEYSKDLEKSENADSENADTQNEPSDEKDQEGKKSEKY